ncbi:MULTISPECIES: hypothetical protein [Burkholderiaceae]|uniref:hypothetical protein n=1 Tax=Burkholderiaceae TaxID=119060 RepID=UPI00158AC2B1|nr:MULTISPECIES: hypothetical protein [Burkholderiaceae]MCG1017309.1 hypothetical protein [Mycetohabitans sp. B4]
MAASAARCATQWQAGQEDADPSAWQEFADPFPQWSEAFDHVSDADDPPKNTPGVAGVR